MNEKIVYEPSETTHWKTLFASKSMMLGAHNLNPGEELIAEIETIDPTATIKNKKGGEETIVAVHFKNAPPMCLNITNARIIAGLYGEYHDGWIGNSIQLYATKVKAFGSEVMALRVREAIPDTGHDVTDYIAALQSCGDIDELVEAYMSIPKHLKAAGSDSGRRLNETKEVMKGRLHA